MTTKTAPRTVRDVMQLHVMSVTPDMSVRRLVQLLSTNRISGAPVLDESGKILGVVSSSDVLRLAAQDPGVSFGGGLWREPAARGEEGNDEDGEEVPWYFTTLDPGLTFPEEGLNGELDDYLVEDIMTPAAFTIAPDEALSEVARFLYRGRIHRALVVDHGMLLGIVTPFDLLPILIEREEPFAAGPSGSRREG